MNRLRLRKAFTVVEMVIVIAVIAILSAVLIPTISGVIQKANVSADQQFAASLNIQLALWEVDNGEIKNESDLRDAINEFYGEKDEAGNLITDYYATLAPKSGKNGYHFWYDVDNKQVVVSTYEGFLPKDENEGVPADVGMLTFSPASLRSLLINTKEGEKNYYLMDQAGDELVNLIVAFENLGDDSKVGSGSSAPAQQYEYTINQLKGIAETGSLAEILLNKVQITTIVTGEGAYRFNDVNAIKHVYVPLSATVINVQNVYEYIPGADGADGTVITSDDFKLALPENVHVVQIPAGVKIASNGFPAMSECTNPGVDGDWEEATVLEILASSMSQLTDADGNFMFDVQTSNPVFKLLGSGLFFMEDDQVYNLPYTDGDTAVEIGGTVGTGTSENLEVEVSFPDASVNAGSGDHYYDSVDKILYVQYDQTSVPITVKNGTYVNWEYSPASSAGLITVSGNTLTINDADSSTVEHDKIKLSDNNQIKVTGKINDEEKVSFTVCLIMPREISVGTYTSTYDGVGVVGAKPIEIAYDGTNDSVTFDFSVSCGKGQNSKVATWAVSVSSKENKFTPSLDTDNTKLTITLKADTYTFEDVLNVTVGSETFSFSVKCTDTSGAAFDNALFYDDPSTDEYVQGKDVKIGEKYLFRVGNKNGITLGQLFTTEKAYADVAFKLYDYSYSGRPLIDGNSAQKVTLSSTAQFVEVKDKDTNEITERYWTTTRADWAGVTLQFHNTGVVKISIGTMQNGTFKEDKFVLLEVVNGTNINTDDYNEMESATNPVLWHDVTMPTGDYQYTLKNATLYGNGYKFDVSGGRTKGTIVSENYLVSLNNGTLDNVELVGAVYSTFGSTVSEDNNNALVLVTGDSYIYNSYLANCMSAVRVKGNLLIQDTTIQGGSFANMEIREGTVTFKGKVVTINQVDLNAAAGINNVGMGIVVYYENVPETTQIIVNGTLTQYNFLSEEDDDKMGSPKAGIGVIDYTGILLNLMLNESDYAFEVGNTTWVHTGIVSMMGAFDLDNLEGGLSGYQEKTGISLNSATGTVWAIPARNGEATMKQMAEDYSAWQPFGQGVTRPKVTPNTSSWVDNGSGNDWKKWQNGKVDISMDKGDSTTWNPNILTITKGSSTLAVNSIKVKGYDTEYLNKSIPFGKDGFGAGEYVIVYTYTDSNNYNTDGTAKDITYEYTVKVKVSEVAATAKNAEFTFVGYSEYGTKQVTVGSTIYIVLDINDSDIKKVHEDYDVSKNEKVDRNDEHSVVATLYYTNSDKLVYQKTISGTNYYFPATPIVMSDGKTSHTSGWYAYFPVFKDVISITDYEDKGTGAAIPYNGSTTEMPTNLVVDNPTATFKYQSGTSAGATPTLWSNALHYSSAKIEAYRGYKSEPATYTYTDSKGASYTYYVAYYAPPQTYANICVTPDTLVTLADGSQKEIQYVTYEDQMLVWNFYEGKYDVISASYLMNHGYGNYNILHLNFEDGTTVKVIGRHGFFDADNNEFVFITEENVADCVGHNFTKQDGTLVKLNSYSITEEYTESYSLLTYEFFNCYLEGMLSLTPPEIGGNVFMPFELGEDMTYDAVQLQKDIETYGLCTYEEYADVIPEAIFEALNMKYIKITIGKEIITESEVNQLLAMHFNP